VKQREELQLVGERKAKDGRGVVDEEEERGWWRGARRRGEGCAQRGVARHRKAATSGARSFLRSFVRWLVGWLVGWLVRSFARPFVRSSVRPFVRSPIIYDGLGKDSRACEIGRLSRLSNSTRCRRCPCSHPPLEAEHRPRGSLLLLCVRAGSYPRPLAGASL
jgi:hypothetical protein